MANNGKRPPKFKTGRKNGNQLNSKNAGTGKSGNSFAKGKKTARRGGKKA